MKTTYPTFAALLLVITSTASAQIYKWVDSNGQLHYTERPAPAGKKAETIEDKIRIAASLKRKNKTRSSYIPDTSNEESETKKTPSNREEIANKQKEANDNYRKELDSYCSSQRSNLSLLKTSSPIAWEENGKTELLSGKQKQDKIKTISASVNKNCDEVKSSKDSE